MGEALGINVRMATVRRANTTRLEHAVLLTMKTMLKTGLARRWLVKLIYALLMRKADYQLTNFCLS